MIYIPSNGSEELSLEEGVKSLAKDALDGIHGHDVVKVIHDVECLADCSQMEGRSEEGVVLSFLVRESYLACAAGAEQKLEEEVTEIYLHPDKIADPAKADPNEKYDLRQGIVYRKAS